MALIIALIAVSLVLVVVGIAVKTLLWLAVVGAVLLLGTFVFVAISGRTS